MHSLARRPDAGLVDAISACGPELLPSARQLVGAHEADDLIQNTLERALKHAGSFQPNTNLMAWLRRIMSNLAVDSWRHQNRHPRCSLDQRDMAAPEPESSAPWEELSAADLGAAVAQLKPPFRAAFELYCRGVPYAEIARRLGIPVGTVGTRLLRGRAALRILLSATLARRTVHGAPMAPVVQMVIARKPGRPIVRRIDGHEEAVCGAA